MWRSHIEWNVSIICCAGFYSRRLGSRSSSFLPNLIVVLAIVLLRNGPALFVACGRDVAKLWPIPRIPTHSVLALVLCAPLVGLFIFRPKKDHRSVAPTSPPLTARDIDQRARLYPCQTSHTRLFPTPHSFSYSYLYSGVGFGPMEASDPASTNNESILAVSPHISQIGIPLFSVCSDDYLGRKSTNTAFSFKLRDYLDSQGQPSEQFSYVYLVTAPRFLGFSFNPVSFWYLYSKEKCLTAMVLEVNNTFDERRMYFMKADPGGGPCQAQNHVFRHSWKKDFHVSPFNGRDGSYVLKAKDPFWPGMSGAGWIDNTITLLSSEGKPKVVARVFSVQPSVNGSKLNGLQMLRFVYRWWWVGFATNFRILHEARKLWKKNLQLFYRPEVVETSIGRRATPEEDVLAEQFLIFLRFVQSHSLGRLSIRYTAAAGRGRACVDNIASGDASAEHIEMSLICSLNVLTPAFYASFMQYDDAVDAFQRLCLCEEPGQRLAILTSPVVFLQQVKDLNRIEKPLIGHELRRYASLQVARQGLTSCLLADLLGDTQGRFADLYLTQSTQRMSCIDFAVLSDRDSSFDVKEQYVRAAHSVLLAQRISLGSTKLLRLYRTTARAILLWLVATRLEMIWSLTIGRDMTPHMWSPPS